MSAGYDAQLQNTTGREVKQYTDLDLFFGRKTSDSDISKVTDVQAVTGDVTETYSATYDQDVTGAITVDGSTINLNNGTKGAARLDDTVDTGDDPAGISGSDGSNKIESASTTVIIGD